MRWAQYIWKSQRNATYRRLRELNSADLSIYPITIQEWIKYTVLSRKLWEAMTVYTSILTLGATIQKYSTTQSDSWFQPAIVIIFCLTTLQWWLAVWAGKTSEKPS